MNSMGLANGVIAMGANNFDTHPDYRHDLFMQVQSIMPGLSDIRSGNADKFVKRAYTQNYWHTEDKLAEEQENFHEQDMVNNTPGRGYKNYRRMEYDITKNPNGKGAAEDRAEAERRKVLTVSEVLDFFKDHKYTLCTTASAVSNEPIKQSDYQDQIKLR